MPILILDEATGRVTAVAEGNTAHITGLSVENVPVDLTELFVIGGTIIQGEAQALQAAKAIRKATIKQEAALRISALDWRVTRAQEKAQLGLPGESVEDVLLMREAIRQGSNEAEQCVDDLTELAAVRSYTWPEFKGHKKGV